jgi:hypothetical protein
MLYVREKHVSRNIWELTAPQESTKPFATVTRSRGQCSATTTAGHALNREELACLLDVMQQRERAA